MQANHIIAGKALKLMFIGALLGLIATAMGLIPGISALSGIVTLVGGVLCLVGLIQAGPAHKLYGRAILMLVLGIACTVISTFVIAGGTIGGSVGVILFGAVLMMGVSVFGLLQVYCICKATSTLLREAGNETSAAKGDTAFKINALCYIIVIVLTVVSLFAPTVAGILTIANGILGIVGSILYVIFLKDGTDTLTASGAAQ